MEKGLGWEKGGPDSDWRRARSLGWNWQLGWMASLSSAVRCSCDLQRCDWNHYYPSYTSMISVIDTRSWRRSRVL